MSSSSTRRLVELLGASSSTNAAAASGTGTSQTPSQAIAPNSGAGSSTGTANDPTISTAPNTNANADAATATGAGYDATTSVSPGSGVGTGTGSAYNAVASVSHSADAGIATATGTAYNAIEREDTDGASAHESELVEVQISDSDTGTGADTDITAGVPITDTETGTGTENNGTVFVSTPAPGDPGGATTPRWIFVDGTESYSFTINPTSTVEPERSKNIVYQNTLGPSGKTLIFETQDNQLILSWSGTTLTQAEYEALITWFDKRNEFQLLDDLGRIYTIYVTEFTPKRKRSIDYPWLHEYDMKALVLSEA